MKRVKILVAEDHEMVRNKLIAVLKLQELEVVGEARNGEEAVAKAKELKPDIVLMDLKMPKLDGISACCKIKKFLPGCKVLVLTSFEEDELIQDAVSANVDGYLLKDVTPKELVKALMDTLKGGYPLDSQVARKLVGKLKIKKKNRRAIIRHGLTSREMDVLKLLAEGRSNKEIGSELCISLHTVKYHVYRIMKKLGKSDRAQAVIYAVKCGIIRKK